MPPTPSLVLVINPLTLLTAKLPPLPSTRQVDAQLAQLRARNFHHLDFEQHLLHAADGDVVDHLRGVVLGQLHDLADVVRLIDEALQHQALAVAVDFDRRVRELRLQGDFELADVAVDQHVDRVDLAVFVPQVDLRDAGLLGRDLHLGRRERRDGQQVGVVDLDARNVLVEREDAAGVGRQLELVAQAADLADRREATGSRCACGRQRAPLASTPAHDDGDRDNSDERRAERAARDGYRTSLYFLRGSGAASAPAASVGSCCRNTDASIQRRSKIPFPSRRGLCSLSSLRLV